LLTVDLQLARGMARRDIGRRVVATDDAKDLQFIGQGGVSLRFASLRALHRTHTRERDDVTRGPRPAPVFANSRERPSWKFAGRCGAQR
jgi:hypothetical protein